jgi:DNA-binding PadR family transcriptional regulator
MSDKRPLTVTSFAILGLLALRPWRSYDLAKQIRRSQSHIWPRAESNLYAEAKRLVTSGHAVASVEKTGERRRTVYTITPLGRSALRAWLDQAGGETRFESEALLKVYFADHGTKADLVKSITAIGEAAEGQRAQLMRIADEYRAGNGPFPERLHVGILALDLIWEQLGATVAWAQRAAAEVKRWPATQRGDRSWPPANPSDFQKAFLAPKAVRKTQAP